MNLTKKLVNNSLPIIVGSLFYPLFTLVNTALFGNMENSAYLVAYGLVYMLLGLGIESLGIGFNSCVETLVAQAYGAGDHRMCKVYLNRQQFMNTVAFTVLTIPLYFAEPIFRDALDQNEEITKWGAQGYQIIAVGMYF